jgi:hypothetical protein
MLGLSTPSDTDILEGNNHDGEHCEKIWRAAFTATFAILLLTAVTPARADLATGSWNTEWGVMALTNGQGSYAHNDGRIYGTMQGDHLVGYWTQSSSGQRCSSALYGSQYWGRIDFTFDQSGNFKGQWSYCEGGWAGSWSGTRQASAGAPVYSPPPSTTPVAVTATGSWKTEWGVMTLVDGQGSYAFNDGRIYGTLQGDHLLGYWTQSTSGQRCSSALYGTYYWGKIDFAFDQAGNFKGQWSYCEGNWAGGWSGTRS